MRIKYLELDSSKYQKTFEKLLKKGFKQDNIFTDKESAERHIQNLYNEGKDVIVITETHVVRYYVFSKSTPINYMEYD